MPFKLRRPPLHYCIDSNCSPARRLQALIIKLCWRINSLFTGCVEPTQFQWQSDGRPSQVELTPWSQGIYTRCLTKADSNASSKDASMHSPNCVNAYWSSLSIAQAKGSCSDTGHLVRRRIWSFVWLVLFNQSRDFSLQVNIARFQNTHFKVWKRS